MTPTWQAALDMIVARTGHQHYRVLCAEDNPDADQRDDYRALMVRKATGNGDGGGAAAAAPLIAPRAYPSPGRQLANAASAAGRAIAAAATGCPVVVDSVEQARRLAICRTCDQLDRNPERCRLCGCFVDWKTRIATESCPKHPPLW